MEYKTGFSSVFRLLAVFLLFSTFSRGKGGEDVVVEVFGRFQSCVQVEKQYKNPFNYSEVLVQAKLSGPDGSVTVDGFYYQNYTRSESGGSEVLTPIGKQEWCVRYAPRNAGTFLVTIVITDASGTRELKKTNFSAIESGNAKGFIQNSKNGIHFQYSDGSTYFPIGENVCWVSSKGTYDYDMYFGSLGSVGCNYARLWLTDSGWDDLAVEVEVGNYSLENTWRLDYVVELAERKGIHLLMCTESFNYFCTKSTAPCNWDKDCYYNKKFGGFLDKPEEFFTDARAKADYKNRLRYLVARYGYSTAVFAWEFFNEVDITDNYDTNIQLAWNKEMSAYVQSLDVYDHMISTSYSNSDGDSNVQASSALDFTMTHNYNSRDIAQETAQYPYKKLSLYHKPSYVAEFGIGDQNEDKQGVSLHNGLWAPLFSLAAGSCMTWWWDSWVDPNDLYPIFEPFAKFLSQLQLAQTDSWTQAQLSTNTSTARALGMWGGDSILLWVQDECYTWYNQHIGEKCTQKTNVSLTAKGCVSGKTYSGKWYSTQTADVVKQSTVQCNSAEELIDILPPFTTDLAGVFNI